MCSFHLPARSLARRVRPALLVLGLWLAGPAMATQYNIDAVERHGDWHSLTLSLGEERHMRALEQHSYRDTVFSVNASPGACDRPWLEVRVELDAHQPESGVVNRVPVDLLVDQGRGHRGQGEFITGRGDSGFYVRLSLPDTARLLEEMAGGEILRLRIHRAEADYWFLVFSLAGAGEALARTRALCERAGQATEQDAPKRLR